MKSFRIASELFVVGEPLLALSLHRHGRVCFGLWIFLVQLHRKGISVERRTLDEKVRGLKPALGTGGGVRSHFTSPSRRYGGRCVKSIKFCRRAVCHTGWWAMCQVFKVLYTGYVSHGMVGDVSSL